MVFFKNIFCFESLLNFFFDKANQNNIKKYINLISFQVYQVKRIQI